LLTVVNPCASSAAPASSGALAAAADQHDRAFLAAGHPQHLVGEVRIDLEVRRRVPLDVDRVDRVADIEVLDLGAAVDQQRIRVGLQGVVGFLGVRCFMFGSWGGDYRARPGAAP